MLFALGHIDICNTDDADYSLIKNYHYYKKKTFWGNYKDSVQSSKTLLMDFASQMLPENA